MDKDRLELLLRRNSIPPRSPISQIWLNRFEWFAVCLGFGSLILFIATVWMGDAGRAQFPPGNAQIPVMIIAFYGALAALLIGLFTRRMPAVVVGASAFFITALVVPGNVRPRGGNEASAIGSMRSVNSAQSTYSSSCGGNGYAQSLEDLIKPPEGSTAGFIAPELSRNGVIKSGYVVTVMAGPEAEIVTAASQTCNHATGPAMSSYFAEAHPVEVGKTGQRSFATDARGTIYFNNTGERIRPGMAGASVLY